MPHVKYWMARPAIVELGQGAWALWWHSAASAIISPTVLSIGLAIEPANFQKKKWIIRRLRVARRTWGTEGGLNGIPLDN